MMMGGEDTTGEAASLAFAATFAFAFALAFALALALAWAFEVEAVAAAAAAAAAVVWSGLAVGDAMGEMGDMGLSAGASVRPLAPSSRAWLSASRRASAAAVGDSSGEALSGRGAPDEPPREEGVRPPSGDSSA